MKRILIAGVGNVLLGDDGVGPYVARLLAARYDFGAGVEVEDLGTPGLDLVVHLSDAEVIVIVDCVNDQKPAGTVTTYSREDIIRCGTAIRVDGHSPALTESLLIAEFASDTPKEIALVGISGKPSDGVELSPKVREALEPAIAAVLRQLDTWCIPYGAKIDPSAPEVWWEPLGVSI